LAEQHRLGKLSKLFVGIDDESPSPVYYDVLIRPNLLDLPPPPSFTPEFYYWQGKDYIILHPEFGRQSVRAIKAPSGPRRWLICFGGSDPGNLTRRLAPILKEFRGKIRAHLILGCAFREADQIRALIEDEPHISLTINCQNMAQAFAKADLAIISGGTLLYEGAALGVPMVVLAQNRSQQIEAEIFATRGAAINLGLHDEVRDQDLIDTLDCLINGSERLAAMSAAGVNLVSPHGTHRIVTGLVDLSKGGKFCRKSSELCSQPTFHG
jgi:spore coat polysaccharide biosynthesis predicted glycosyltransferase SpsG